MVDTKEFIIDVLNGLKAGNYNDLSINDLLQIYDDFIKVVVYI